MNLSPAGSEFSCAIGLARLNCKVCFVTRLPDNPYGRLIENIALRNRVETSCIVWAPAVEPIGRMLYDIGRTPRQSAVTYQRMYSAASKLGRGAADWKTALKDCSLFHLSGITFGLAVHCGNNNSPELAAQEAAFLRRACPSGLQPLASGDRFAHSYSDCNRRADVYSG